MDCGRQPFRIGNIRTWSPTPLRPTIGSGEGVFSSHSASEPSHPLGASTGRAPDHGYPKWIAQTIVQASGQGLHHMNPYQHTHRVTSLVHERLLEWARDLMIQAGVESIRVYGRMVDHEGAGSHWSCCRIKWDPGPNDRIGGAIQSVGEHGQQGPASGSARHLETPRSGNYFRHDEQLPTVSKAREIDPKFHCLWPHSR